MIRSLIAIILFCFSLTTFGNNKCLNNYGFYCDKSMSPKLIEKFKVVKNNELSIFWWNIAGGAIGSNDLNKNLDGMVSSSIQPDIILLGEYTGNELSYKVLKDINKLYPYSKNINYNSKNKNTKLKIFSKFKFNLLVNTTIDATPIHATPNEIEDFTREWLDLLGYAKSLERPYNLIELSKNNKKYYISFTHLLNPWSGLLEKIKRNRPSWLEKTAKIALFRKISFGSNDPLYHQIEKLKNRLSVDIKTKIPKKAPFILVGDFNAPKNSFPKEYSFSTLKLKSNTYRVLSKDLIDVFKNIDINTIPTETSKTLENKYSFQIDHIFRNKTAIVVENEILYLKGSDHYPLWTIIK